MEAYMALKLDIAKWSRILKAVVPLIRELVSSIEEARDEASAGGRKITKDEAFDLAIPVALNLVEVVISEVA
jgi:hypothetical protein